MSAGDDVRRKISNIEFAMRDAGAAAVNNAIIETLREIADALDEVEKEAKRD